MTKAVIFDMDGVISDTQKFHAEVESAILKKFDIYIAPNEISDRYAGVSDDAMFKEIFAQHNIKIPDLTSLIFKKWEMMIEISQGRITAIPYAIKLINSLKEDGFKIAIASSSPLSFIHYVITSFHIEGQFDTLVSAQEVKRGKPDPDIFLLAAKRLEVNPKDCIVIEDGRSGMIGAKTAGMKSVGLVSCSGDWPADLLVTSLKQLNIKKIIQLLK